MDDSIVEVVWIALVLILETVEEVEEVEGECHCRTVDRCRKPVYIEELNGFGKGCFTTAVTDNEMMNAR